MKPSFHDSYRIHLQVGEVLDPVKTGSDFEVPPRAAKDSCLVSYTNAGFPRRGVQIARERPYGQGFPLHCELKDPPRKVKDSGLVSYINAVKTQSDLEALPRVQMARKRPYGQDYPSLSLHRWQSDAVTTVKRFFRS